jgi:class 3 adenylate cyclase
MADIPTPLGITPEEVSSLTTYIRSKNTAVLTVMFTDIEGFTRLTEVKGEEYSRDLRRHHDKIVVDAIEKDGAGLVIKFIGDAVMAVFAEPSAAVSAALRIQGGLRDFAAEHPDLDRLLVRIGLHMGQVAVEENLQTDVFGRHVNRASRIEALAAGGQIYMSHAVFDSARGWLGAQNRLGWTRHGSYFLKGIDEPVDIYEVCERGVSQPRPPRHGKRKRGFPKLATAVALVAAGAVIGAAVLLYQRTELWLLPPYPQDLRIDGGGRVSLEGEEGDEQRRVASEVGIGRHVLRYDVADGVRYYAAIEVARGKNFIKPKYEESRLPGLILRSGVEEQPAGKVSRSSTGQYFFYDGAGERYDEEVELTAEIESRRDPAAPDVAQHRLVFRITKGGATLEEGAVEARQAIAAEEATRVGPVTLIEHPPIAFYYEYYTVQESVELTLGARFIEEPPE